MKKSGGFSEPEARQLKKIIISASVKNKLRAIAEDSRQ
jgi:hypothetical protein